MKLYSKNNNYKLYQGSMLDMLEVIEPNSIDSIVTDPPYELNFMSKGWDNAGISFQPDTWKKCYKVLKPGGYLLAFGGSRTFHRIAVAIEDAGFEIRDTIMWLYGSGFPKSMNVGLAIDKKNGVDNRTGNLIKQVGKNPDNELWGANDRKNGKGFGFRPGLIEERIAQNKWNGWGTALKPSFEPIIVARKPFKGSLVDNVIEYGVGGINIDECRVGNEELCNSYAGNKNSGFTNADERDEKGKGMFSGNKKGETIVNGRFPANTILTYDETDYDEVCGGFPDTKGGNRHNTAIRKSDKNSGYGFDLNTRNEFNDSGSASRYFYCAKASKKDRDEGLDIEIEEYVLKEDIPTEIEQSILNSLTSQC